MSCGEGRPIVPCEGRRVLGRQALEADATSVFVRLIGVHFLKGLLYCMVLRERSVVIQKGRPTVANGRWSGTVTGCYVSGEFDVQ